MGSKATAAERARRGRAGNGIRGPVPETLRRGLRVGVGALLGIGVMAGGCSAPASSGASPSPSVVAETAAYPTAPAGWAAAQPNPTDVPAASAAADPVSAAAAPRQLAGNLLKDTAADFAAAESSDGVDISDDGLRLAEQGGGYVSTAQYISAVRETPSTFDNAILSWNAEAPAGTSLRFELRIRNGSSWSSWFIMGEWGPDGGRSVADQSDAVGAVDIDTLVLKAAASAMQYRVTLSTTSPSSSPLVRQVAVTFADMAKGLTGPVLPKGVAWGKDLEVPQHSQLEEDPAVRSEICSATSLAMVLQYWGVNRTVADVYRGVQDRTENIYGNWPLNVAYAAANGMEGAVQRFYSVEQLEAEIAAGRPVIISISFKPGDLSASPIASTSGHLIVVRGFTSDGDVIVNDPIAPNSQSVRLVYNREQLSKVWLRSGGVAYLVAPRGRSGS